MIIKEWKWQTLADKFIVLMPWLEIVQCSVFDIFLGCSCDKWRIINYIPL